MAELTAEVAAWLCSGPGLDAVAESAARLDEGLDTLTVGSRLRSGGMHPDRATAVLGAATARRRARERWPDADRLLFTPDGLEQASDPGVAAWRATRLAGRAVWDLCAGLGSDALALAAAGADVTAVDLDAGRLRLLEHNAAELGLQLKTLQGDALEVRPPADALVHADPSRRSAGRRLRRLADHHPAVGRLVAAHAGAPGLGLVLSPAVDLEDPDLPADAELEFVAVGDELKESVAWIGEPRAPRVVASATLLPEGHHRSRDGGNERGRGEGHHRSRGDGHHRSRVEGPPRRPGDVHHRSRDGERPATAVRAVGTYLVDVVPAAVRARLHEEIGAEVGAGRIARRRALLTADDRPPPSPWYRVRPVLGVLPARPKAVRRWLRAHADVPVEIVVHGVAADPVQWWRQLGRPPRGPQGLRIELVRTDDGAQAVITDVRPTR